MNSQTIHLPDTFDLESVKQVRPDLDATLLPDGGIVRLDLSNVSFIDSSGVGAIIHLFKRLRSQQRELILCGVHGQPRRILQLLRVDRAIPFEESFEQDLQL
ncbi:STAS domain-containing protein [Ferrimonas pelagia]|uniref:STAS domain-containing protein n=1 Tax=Ferrimonas pelagia TaxID=1177826 RepID=A0ABP9FHD2_9GAMM